MHTDDRLTLQRKALRDRGVCVIIPTFNNAGTIEEVVRRSFAQCDDVIVVCDGCTDDSVALLEAMEPRPAIVKYEKNCGKGKALKEGFRYALKSGFSYAITLDADLQHYPEDIPLFLEASRKWPGELIVGARQGLDGVQRSAGSRFANSFSNFWFALQTLHCLPDTQSGYRLYPIKKLEGLGLLTGRYEAELELMVFASWAGIGLKSIPVNVFYPPLGQRVSHFRPAKDFARIFALNTVLCILALVYGLPRALLRTTYHVLRMTYYVILFAIITLLFVTPYMFLCFHIGKDSEQKKLRLHRLKCRVAGFSLRFGLPAVKFSINNEVGETFERPAVIISNHQSHLDLMSMLSVTPKIVFLTNEWVWHDVFYGYVVRHLEFLRASKGMDELMPQLRSLVERGYSIVVYPEGTRSMDGKIARFHKGAFYMAQQLDIPILPTVIYGSGKAYPKHGKMLHAWPIHIEIGKRVEQEELSQYSLKEQASLMRKYCGERYTAIADKFEQDV